VAENTTAVGTVTATDADLPAQTVSFSLNGGVDAAKFSITSGGVLSFNSAPDYERKSEGLDYSIVDMTFRADNGNGSTTDHSIAETVNPLNDLPPLPTRRSSDLVAENTTAVGTVTATDADLPAQTVSFSLNGGVDAAKFSITSGGVLSFNSAPD